MAAAAGGGVRLGVTFGGQGKAWLPLLRHLWDVYRPVVQPFLDRMAQALSDAAGRPKESSQHLSHGLDFLGWLHGPPPPDPYLLSAPVTLPMTAVLQLAHFWLCWHCLGLPFEELQRRVVGASGHSLGIVSAVVLAAADSWEGFLQCSVVAVTLLLRIGLRAAEVYRVDAAVTAAGVGATPMLSVAHLTSSEVQRYVADANARLPPTHRITIALINGPTLTVVAGPPSSLLTLTNILRSVSVEAGRVPISTTFLASSVPFHSWYLQEAIDLVKQDVSDFDIHFPLTGAFPVHSTTDGAPVPFGHDLPARLAALILATPVDWVRCAAALDATHIVDFGPPGTALLTHQNRSGDGITVIAASEILPPSAAVAPKAALFDARAVAITRSPSNPHPDLPGGPPAP
eukprot:EG_transcript_14710